MAVVANVKAGELNLAGPSGACATPHPTSILNAERHRSGLRVGTAITEGTANFLVN
jgi:hypothetical protein